MKFRNKRLVGLFTAGSMIIAMSVQTPAATSGISAGISETIAANIESSADANAGTKPDSGTHKMPFIWFNIISMWPTVGPLMAHIF